MQLPSVRRIFQALRAFQFDVQAPECTLTVLIDEATARSVELPFSPSETTLDSMYSTKRYVKQYEIPVALYSEKHTVFQAMKKANGEAILQCYSYQEALLLARKRYWDRLIYWLNAAVIPKIGKTMKLLSLLFGSRKTRILKKHEASMSFDLENIYPFLTDFENKYKLGLNSKALEKFVASVQVEHKETIETEITYSGQTSLLDLRVFMDDIDTTYLYLLFESSELRALSSRRCRTG